MWAMKILFVSPVGAMFSGAEVSIVNLMKLLVQQGHEVYNVIPDNAPHIDKDYLRHMDTTGIKLFQLKTNQWWWPESKTLDISDLEIQASQQKNIDEVREIIQNEQIELVISTINLPEIALPVVYVSAFFNDADIRRVTEKIITDKLHRAAISAVDNEVLYP